MSRVTDSPLKPEPRVIRLPFSKASKSKWGPNGRRNHSQGTPRNEWKTKGHGRQLLERSIKRNTVEEKASNYRGSVGNRFSVPSNSDDVSSVRDGTRQNTYLVAPSVNTSVSAVSTVSPLRGEGRPGMNMHGARPSPGNLQPQDKRLKTELLKQSNDRVNLVKEILKEEGGGDGRSVKDQGLTINLYMHGDQAAGQQVQGDLNGRPVPKINVNGQNPTAGRQGAGGQHQVGGHPPGPGRPQIAGVPIGQYNDPALARHRQPLEADNGRPSYTLNPTDPTKRAPVQYDSHTPSQLTPHSSHSTQHSVLSPTNNVDSAINSRASNVAPVNRPQVGVNANLSGDRTLPREPVNNASPSVGNSNFGPNHATAAARDGFPKEAGASTYYNDSSPTRLPYGQSPQRRTAYNADFYSGSDFDEADTELFPGSVSTMHKPQRHLGGSPTKAVLPPKVQFENRMDASIRADMQQQQQNLDGVEHGRGRLQVHQDRAYDVGHGHGHANHQHRKLTPDHLKNLSAKHFLDENSRTEAFVESQNRLNNFKENVPPDPSRRGGLAGRPPLPEQRHGSYPNINISASRRRRHRHPRASTRNVETNTGTIKYLIKGSHSDASSVTTYGSERETPLSLPNIHLRHGTRRVRESEAQTDFEVEDFSEEVPQGHPSSPTTTLATQTQHPQLEQVVVPAKERGIEVATQADCEQTEPRSREMAIQTFDEPKEIALQTEVQPGWMSSMGTQTEIDLSAMNRLEKANEYYSKKTPHVPQSHLYKSENMYKLVKNIISDEDQPPQSNPRLDAPEEEPPGEKEEIGDDALVEDNEVYVGYMQTEDGAILGPFQLNIDSIQVGLPVPRQTRKEGTETSTEEERYIDMEGGPGRRGLRNRQTSSNTVNEHSSRSHSMLTLNLDSELQDPDDDTVYITKHGKLTFVDLAGSEKTKNDGQASQEHLQESNNINRSLLVLGNCISALGDSKKRGGHIPYRDSKLTKLLADSLGGNGVTLMIACVSPSAYNSAETINTLRYANRAKKIKSKPVVRMDPREKLILSLKREVKILRQENHYLRGQLEFPVKPRGQLQKENDKKFLQMLKEQKREGRITDHGLYEMLQEYMIENESLRTENSDMHQLRDTGRREQQQIARENERLMRKLETIEKERMVMTTPVSMYSVGSNLSRKSSLMDDAPRGPPPDQWAAPGYKDGGRQQKKTPPGHLQHPSRPPHRLQAPVNKSNPAYIDSPRNDYMNHHPDLPPAGTPRDHPHQGASYPNPQRAGGGREDLTGRSHQEAPRPTPRKNPGVRVSQAMVPLPSHHQHSHHSNHAPSHRDHHSDHHSDHAPSHRDDDTDSLTELNERLRQDLLDLEGQIKQQTRVSSQSSGRPR